MLSWQIWPWALISIPQIVALFLPPSISAIFESQGSFINDIMKLGKFIAPVLEIDLIDLN